LEQIATGNGNPSISHTGVAIMLEPPPLMDESRAAPKATDAIKTIWSSGVSDKTVSRLPETSQLCRNLQIDFLVE
jgi:hypothetical protein